MAPLPVLTFGTNVAPPTEQQLPPFSAVHLTDDLDPSSLSFKHLAQTVMKAKRIAVVCGAGISCASGIPDFRSADGLFESLKKQHPSARLSSGKDLFDASLFASETNAAIFYTMIAELKNMADKATPTAFHRLLKVLDDEGKLFRVYTQNIDGLEAKAGLSYGLGGKATSSPPASASNPAPAATTSRSSRASRSRSPSTPPPAPPTPPHNGTPRCIPLHGVLSHVYCQHCSHTSEINPYLPLLASGQTSACPSCTKLDQTRQSLGERSRGVGWLKPSVVLYNESHPEGERVGEITRKDLLGVRPDLLLVVGTSLKVPGTKLLVRELAKVIRPPPKDDEEEDEDEEMPPASGSTVASSASQAARSRTKKPKKVHSIYLNFDFPTPSREFKDSFDVWARGDVQEFVAEVMKEREEEKERIKRKAEEREKREMRKAEREAAIESGLVVGKGKGKAVPGASGEKKPTAKVAASRAGAKPKPAVVVPTPAVPKKKKRPPPHTSYVNEPPKIYSTKTRTTKPPTTLYQTPMAFVSTKPALDVRRNSK